MFTSQQMRITHDVLTQYELENSAWWQVPSARHWELIYLQILTFLIHELHRLNYSSYLFSGKKQLICLVEDPSHTTLVRFQLDPLTAFPSSFDMDSPRTTPLLFIQFFHFLLLLRNCFLFHDLFQSISALFTVVAPSPYHSQRPLGTMGFNLRNLTVHDLFVSLLRAWGYCVNLTPEFCEYINVVHILSESWKRTWLRP